MNMNSGWLYRTREGSSTITVILGLALVVIAALPTVSPARELPARVVVLDEQSPHLALVAEVRDAFSDQLDAAQATSPGPEAPAPVVEGEDSSAQGILKRLTREVIDGTLELPQPRLAASGLDYTRDPLVAAVAADLDLEVGAYTVAYARELRWALGR